MAKERSPEEPEEQVEDLDVAPEESEDVKGGAGIFLKIGDIKGESLDSKHSSNIEVSSYRPQFYK